MVAAARSISTSAARPPVARSDAGVVRGLDRFVSAASMFSVAVGLLALIGWVLDIAVLKSVIPGQVVIKPNAAVTLVLCGCSLWLLRGRDAQPPQGIRKVAGQALASLVALVGLLTLSEHLIGWNLGTDQLLFIDQDPFEAFGSLRRADGADAAPGLPADGRRRRGWTGTVSSCRRYGPSQSSPSLLKDGAIVCRSISGRTSAPIWRCRRCIAVVRSPSRAP